MPPPRTGPAFSQLTLMMACVAAMVFFAPQALHARVQLVEPWAPGLDMTIPSKLWTHGADLRLGLDSADLFELSYNLSHAPRSDWEIEGTLGYASLDQPNGLEGDSGLNDLTIGVKHSLPLTALLDAKSAGEAGVSLPTGDPDQGLGAGGVGFLFGWGAEAPVQRALGYVHFGFRAYTEGSDTRFGNIFSFVLGAAHRADTSTRLSLDLRGFNRGKDKINGLRARESVQELYLSPGGQWKPRDDSTEFLANILIGLTEDSHDIGLFGGVKF